MKLFWWLFLWLNVAFAALLAVALTLSHYLP